MSLCLNCKYANHNTGGALHYCEKHKKKVHGNDRCDDWEESYASRMGGGHQELAPDWMRRTIREEDPEWQ